VVTHDSELSGFGLGSSLPDLVSLYDDNNEHGSLVLTVRNNPKVTLGLHKKAGHVATKSLDRERIFPSQCRPFHKADTRSIMNVADFDDVVRTDGRRKDEVSVDDAKPVSLLREAVQ
jgi:hypothetical protein